MTWIHPTEADQLLADLRATAAKEADQGYHNDSNITYGHSWDLEKAIREADSVLGVLLPEDLEYFARDLGLLV